MKQHLCSPEVRLTPILFGLAIFSYGCSSSYSVRSTVVKDAYTYGKLNEDLKGQQVEIELKDGVGITAKDVSIFDDSVSWRDVRTEETSMTSIRQVSKIVSKNYFLGGLEGLGFGAVGGGVAGVIVGGAVDNSDAGYGPGFGGLIGTVTGMVVGCIIGSAIGYSYNYEFPTNERNDAARIRARAAVIYLNNGAIIRGTILTESRDGKALMQVTIRHVDGKVHTYASSEIRYIEEER